ncbi:MAG: autophagy protein 5 [Bathelium mastoideum]|nr:MAG: autophagy protein 5 [Bathelium mastoideum]
MSGRLQKKIWEGSVPLSITLSPAECRTYDDSNPYLVQCPRLSYLPFLLPRIRAFFDSSLINTEVQAHEGWFSFEDLPLKWHYPLGVLYDLFSGAEPVYPPDRERGHDIKQSEDKGQNRNNGSEALPWRLVAHFTEWPEDQLVKLDAEGKVLQDAFINGVKEADFLRNGSAKVVMGLSKDDSTALWESVEKHNLPLFNSINNKLLNPPGSSMRHIPIKVPGSLRAVQFLVTPALPSKQPQTLGMALNAMLPTVFPSRRNPILAQAVLHGTVVPLAAAVEELLRAAAYPDGFLHVAVVMMN